VSTLVIDAAAAFRLTRLVVDDSIAEAPRTALLRWSERPGRAANLRARLGELVECYWCVGFWIALGVVTARRVAPDRWDPAAQVLAVSAAVGAAGALHA